jgi:hypothetical protein
MDATNDGEPRGSRSLNSNRQRADSSGKSLRADYREILRQRELFFSPGAASRRLEAARVSGYDGREEPLRLLQVHVDTVFSAPRDHDSDSRSEIQQDTRRSNSLDTSEHANVRPREGGRREGAVEIVDPPPTNDPPHLSGEDIYEQSLSKDERYSIVRLLRVSSRNERNARTRVRQGHRRQDGRAIAVLSRGTSPVRVRAVSRGVPSERCARLQAAERLTRCTFPSHACGPWELEVPWQTCRANQQRALMSCSCPPPPCRPWVPSPSP